MKALLPLFLCLFLLLSALCLAACAEEPAPEPEEPEAPACAHAETVLQGASEAACDSAGYTGDTVCVSCGRTLTRGSEIKALSCSFAQTGTVTLAPTCLQAGAAEQKCTRCGRLGVPAPIDALGHRLAYADAVEDAESGLSVDPTHTVTCLRTDCDYTATEPHEGEATVEEPTCYTPAYKSGTCTACGTAYRAVVTARPATRAHQWSEGTVSGEYLIKECLNAGCPYTAQEPISTPDAEEPPAEEDLPAEEEPPVEEDPPVEEPLGPQPADRIDDTENLNLDMTVHATLNTFTDDNGVLCRIVQGACTDGTYYYVAINDGQSQNAASISAIRKYDLATGDLVATFENLKIAHANDLCYNPVTNEILAVHNSPVRQLVSVFDADSLEFKRQITLALEIYSMSYDPFEDCYWVGLSYGYNFAKLDTDFRQVGEIYEGEATGFTKQGMDVDAKYIYFVQYNTNCIVVYNKQGQYVTQINLPQTAYEAENICHIDDVFYIGYFDGSGGTLYKTVLNAPKPAEINATLTALATLSQYIDAEGDLCHMVQGSCSDGTYIYLAMNNDDSSGYRSAIYKINPQTGAILATYEGLEIGLANDLTYNSATGEIVAVHNKPSATVLSVLDAETLEPLRTVTLGYNVYAIAYDPVQGCYLLGLSGTYDFALLNADFEQLATYTGHASGYTKQGMECDGTYVYFVQSASNNLAVYKTDGTYVGQCALPVGVGSAQSICRVGDSLYIGYNDPDAGGVLYKAQVTVNLGETA